MAQIIFISHIPLIRMERRDDFPIGSGVLTKLPWEQFDDLAQGAFTDWRPKYESADPVFFWHQQDMDLPFVRAGSAKGMEELKITPAGWRTMLPRLGHELISAFQDQLVDPVWAALALAAPAALPPSPRSSVTFCLPAGEAYFEIGNRTMNGVRVQGDADQELVYLPDAACKPLDDSVLERAAGLVAIARKALEIPDIGPALRQLLDTADVSLSPSERLLLAVAAIENLLLPDVTVDSGDVFARRLSNLLGLDGAHRAALFDIARDLHRRRSAVIHADTGKANRIELPPATAEQLLAGAIEAASPEAASGLAIDAIRTQLDERGTSRTPPLALPVSDPPGVAPAYRLGPRNAWFAGTFSSTGSLSSPAGTIVSWSPLVGMKHQGDVISHPDLGVHLTAMASDAVVGMEEKDIRRDFISSVRLDEPLAALAVIAPHEGSMVDEGHVLPLTRLRDLAVVGLRLAGYRAFIDPELLGWYVYEGNLRHRRETVLRQSIIMAMGSARPTSIGVEDLKTLDSAWSLLSRYERYARDAEVDRILDLYRRAHDRRFLPPQTRSGLAGICLEAMLGRFPRLTAPVQLEGLVATLDGVDDRAVAWFEARGRSFRNQSAHGKWTPEPIEAPDLWQKDHEPLTHLLEIARAAVWTLLGIWVEVDPPVRARHGPVRLLTRALRGRLR